MDSINQNNQGHRLWDAIRHGSIEQVQALLDSDPSLTAVIDENGFSPLAYALRNRKLELARLLLEMGASPNEEDDNGITLLYRAAIQGDRSLCELLAQHGAVADFSLFDSETQTVPLAYAAMTGDHDHVKLLLDLGASLADEDDFGRPPVVIPIERNDPKAARLLLSLNREVVNWCDPEDGSTLLHEAALHLKEFTDEHYAFLEELVAAGADLEARDDVGMTPLLSAASEGATEMARWLLDHGADIAARYDDGQTALHRTVSLLPIDRSLDFDEEKYLAVVKLLLERGLPVDRVDTKGRTALHYAAMFACPRFVDCLLAHGANPHLLDAENKTALDLLLRAESSLPDFAREFSEAIGKTARRLSSAVRQLN